MSSEHDAFREQQALGAPADREPLPPEYLGDGVYVLDTEYRVIILRTGNHSDLLCDNQIILEPEVLSVLLRYIERVKENRA